MLRRGTARQAAAVRHFTSAAAAAAAAASDTHAFKLRARVRPYPARSVLVTLMLARTQQKKPTA